MAFAILFLFRRNNNGNCLLYLFKKDETNASFKAREHIIPKCIGGIECLPLGWVSDEVNNEFSALELEFARNNPLITINRMFETKTGRKKHKNREKIILFKDEDEYGLGYIVEGRPITIDCIKCKIYLVVEC